MFAALGSFVGAARVRKRARQWAALAALRPRLDAAAAADIVWTLFGPGVFRLLVVECGWPGDRYETWLVGELTSLLDRQFRVGIGASWRRSRGRWHGIPTSRSAAHGLPAWNFRPPRALFLVATLPRVA